MSDTPEYDTLNQAIRDFYTTIEPDVYVDGWILIAHKRSPQWEAEDSSVVGVMGSPDMTWPMRRGLLDIALTSDKFDNGDDDDD